MRSDRCRGRVRNDVGAAAAATTAAAYYSRVQRGRGTVQETPAATSADGRRLRRSRAGRRRVGQDIARLGLSAESEGRVRHRSKSQKTATGRCRRPFATKTDKTVIINKLIE